MVTVPATYGTLPPEPPQGTIPYTTTTTTRPSEANSPTTTVECRNSDDSACGPFVWTAAPPTTPLIESQVPEDYPFAGPTGAIMDFAMTEGTPARATGVTTIDWGDGTPLQVVGQPCASSGTPHGQWTTPAPWELTRKKYGHRYAEPGTYRLTFRRSMCAPHDRLPGKSVVHLDLLTSPPDPPETIPESTTSIPD
jgi:hypothetical protein